MWNLKLCLLKQKNNLENIKQRIVITTGIREIFVV